MDSFWPAADERQGIATNPGVIGHPQLPVRNTRDMAQRTVEQDSIYIKLYDFHG